MYDIFFISYNELNADDNYKKLKSRFPYAQRIHGIKGIHQAHIAAAKKSFTKMFWVVDGDAEILDTFNFDYVVSKYDLDCVHVWRSKNPLNDLEYGYGGVKLLPKTLTINMDVSNADMTTSISSLFKSIPEISNVTVFNTDPFTTWRSAFRECVKLSSRVIQRQNDDETKNRLNIWCTVANGLYSNYALLGANLGREYGEKFKDDIHELKKINDFDWLKEYFDSNQSINQSKTDTLCAVPWMHLNFEPNGKVVPCCLTSPHNYFSGDLNTDSIEQIWNSQNMKTLRKEMMLGLEPKICNKCFDREKVTGESGRYYHSREFPDILEKISDITLEDGTCTEMKLMYWDFRFSNLCNFKCRSCGPRYSSAWVPDAKKLGYTDQEKVWNIESVNNKTNFDFLKDQVKHVRKIYFAGGEPLLMPEHWQILEMLVQNKRFDVKINYNTNASILEYGQKNVLDFWRQWDKGRIEVWPSIDEIEDRAELIRSGTVWSKVEENLIKMTELSNIILRPGITVGAWNVFRLPEIITRMIEIGVVNKKNYHKNFFINLIFDPSYYHISILPDNFKKEIILKLKDFIQNHNKLYDTSIDFIFTHTLHELEKPFDVDAAKRFLKVTNQIDSVRNENLFDIITEMKCIQI